MAFLQSPSLLQDLSHKHGESPSRPRSARRHQQAQKTLRPISSIANLIHFVRTPNLGEAVEDWFDGSSKEDRARKQRLDDRKQLLYLRMREAIDYADWEASAKELDDIEGNNDWKSVFESLDYDASLVEARLKQLDEARISCDLGRMLFLIRTSLTRDLGDMGNLRMYKHTHVGTKDLVERYISSALETLDALLEVSAKTKCDGMESKYILEQVLSSRQAFGRSALLLSGGATFGMNHIGVLKALWEAHLLPRIISGASAGSIVSAVVCTRTDEEVPRLLATFCDGDLAVFDEEGNEDGLLRKAARFLKHGALFDIGHLTRVMKDLLGDMTFQEAYNRTRKILNICVSSASLYELPRLLNYVTAPNVLIWSAVAASCSVPFVYTAASLLAKDPRTGQPVPWNPSPQRWIDGSVDNDIPMTRLAEMFNVNHFIVSQVNPHVVPFLMKDEDITAREALQHTSTGGSGPTWLNTLSHLAKGEALHRMHTLAELGIFPNLLTKTVSVLSQKYSGDITIFPEISYTHFPRMLSNPTSEFMHQAMLSGERATWPKISIIKNHCAIELALDEAVQKLRARVAFSPSEVELRMTNAYPRKSSGSTPRRRTSRRRPLSHNSTSSAPEPPGSSIPTGSASNLHTNYNRSIRSTPKVRHRKSRSIHTVGVEGTSQPILTPEGEPVSADLLEPTKYSYDVTSSGADELSNLASSSSSTSLSCSSPTKTPSSPTESHSRWPRSLFGSTSQPSTPSHFPGTTFVQSRKKAAVPALSMTPSKISSESVYKRLFHSHSPSQDDSQTSGKPHAGSVTEAQYKGATPKPMKRNWALEIDIPNSTKNLVSRSKVKGPSEGST